MFDTFSAGNQSDSCWALTQHRARHTEMQWRSDDGVEAQCLDQGPAGAAVMTASAPPNQVCDCRARTGGPPALSLWMQANRQGLAHCGAEQHRVEGPWASP
jgi:hypothetical protein